MRTPNHEKGYRPICLQPPQPDDNWPYDGHPRSGFDPRYGVKSPKYEKHVFIRKDQVFFDIESQLAMIAASRRKPDGTEDDSLQTATEKFKPMFCRWIDRHIGSAKGVMSAFVLEKYQQSTMNSISDNEEIDITLLFPEWYDDTTFEQLCRAVHEYVVNATLYEYLSLTLTSKDPVTTDKMSLRDGARIDVKKYVNASKPGRIKKILKPF